MTATAYLLLVAAVVVGFLVLRINREVVSAERSEAPEPPDEADLVISNIVAAERLRQEADAAADPREKASLERLADEADDDADKLRSDLEEQHGKS